MEVKTPDIQVNKVSIDFPKDDKRFAPEIIWKAKNGLNPIIYPVTTLNNWKPGNAVSQAVFREAYETYTSKLPGNWYDGVLNTLDEIVEDEDNKLGIRLGMVRYFAYLTAGLDEFKDNPIIKKPNPIILSGILVTNDGKLIFGKRSAKTSIPRPGKVQESQIGVFGGTYNRKVVIDNSGNENIENSHPDVEMMEEITNELGIMSHELDLKIDAILGDPVLSRTIFLYKAEINLTAEEVNIRFREKGNKDEHFGLVFIDPSENQINDLARENITVATSMALAAIYN